MLVQGMLEDVFLDRLSLPCVIAFVLRVECDLWQVRELWMAQKDVVHPFFFHSEWPSVLDEVFCEEVDERYRLTLENKTEGGKKNLSRDLYEIDGIVC